MPQPSQPDIPLATAGEADATGKRPANGTDGRDRQDTLLLSDVPDAAALMPEAAEAARQTPSRVPQSTAPQNAEPHFPTVDLSPLSQRYELLAEAGHGSMGNVYKARDRETGETVALKLLKPEIASDQSMMERFKKELLFARKITHKNVCRVHDFNRIGGIAYTSMEFVEGDSLRSVLNRFGGLPQRKALDLALQMCSALQEAHAQGIVHRDLKPENVMVDAQGNVKIMDFGIARSMDAMTRLTGSMVGTPAYMAPEQVAGKQVDFRSDIYSLGLILYEIFTGQPAFQAENAVAVALKQMREAPKPPHNIDASIPFGIERSIMKCLEKDPARRFQSVAQLGDALRAPAAMTPAASPMIAPPPAIGGASASSATNHPTHGSSLAPHPLYGASALSMQEPRRRSASGWILLILLLAGGAYGAMRWDQVVQFEREYAPVTASAAKYYYAQAKNFIHPGVAQTNAQPGDLSDAQQDAQTATGTAAPTGNSQASTPQSESPNTAASASDAKPAAKSPAAHRPGAKRSEIASGAPAPNMNKLNPAPGAPAGPSATSPLMAGARAPTASTASTGDANGSPTARAAKAPPAVERRADAALGDAGTLSVPPVNERAPSYLWIGRFESEDRAQEKAKKISDLGLPVIVIPLRRDGNSLFLVLSGPFGPERVGSVMEWLKEQGFYGIRVLKNPMRNGHLVEGVEQDPE